MGVEFVRMLTAAQRHQLVFNCPLCSLLRIGVVGVDIGISGFGSRSRLSGILPEHFGQFDASFRDGGTLGQMMDQPQLGAQLWPSPPTSSAPPMIVTAVLMPGSTGASSIVGALGISIVEAVTATRFLGIVKMKLSLFL